MISETEGRDFRKFILDGLSEACPAFLSGIDDSSPASLLPCTLSQLHGLIALICSHVYSLYQAKSPSRAEIVTYFPLYSNNLAQFLHHNTCSINSCWKHGLSLGKEEIRLSAKSEKVTIWEKKFWNNRCGEWKGGWLRIHVSITG